MASDCPRCETLRSVDADGYCNTCSCMVPPSPSAGTPQGDDRPVTMAAAGSPLTVGIWRWVLVLALVMTGCASARTFTAVTLTATLQAYEHVQFLGVPPVLGDSHAEFLPRAVKCAEHFGAVVAFVPSDEMPGGLWGFYAAEMRLIGVDAGMSVNAQVATILHEVAHVIQPSGLSLDAAQVFAESVSYLVCRRIGLDVWRSSLPYLQQRPTLAIALPANTAAIDAAVELILRELGRKG